MRFRPLSERKRRSVGGGASVKCERRREEDETTTNGAEQRIGKLNQKIGFILMWRSTWTGKVEDQAGRRIVKWMKWMEDTNLVVVALPWELGKPLYF